MSPGCSRCPTLIEVDKSGDLPPFAAFAEISDNPQAVVVSRGCSKALGAISLTLFIPELGLWVLGLGFDVGR